MLPRLLQNRVNLSFLPLPGPGIKRVRFLKLWGFFFFSPLNTASVSSPEVVSAIMIFHCPFVGSHPLPKACGPGTEDPPGPESHRGWTGPRGPLLSCSWPPRCSVLLPPPRSQPDEMNRVTPGQDQNLQGRPRFSFTRKTRGAFSHIVSGPSMVQALKILKGTSLGSSYGKCLIC